MQEIWQAEQPDRLIFVGGPFVPAAHATCPGITIKGVIAILNGMKGWESLCVQGGNCDAEVDQMIWLQFPILADYLMLMLKKPDCHCHLRPSSQQGQERPR